MDVRRVKYGIRWLCSAVLAALLLAGFGASPVAADEDADDDEREEQEKEERVEAEEKERWDATEDAPAKYSSLRLVNDSLGSAWLQRFGVDGSGVGIALIDSGVVPVDELDDPGKVINGPDLSFESQAPGLLHLDTYGHGTHMAGIVAGRSDDFRGIAPDAHLVNLKVATHDGATDVSQVIAAIDWAVQHKDDPGLNIRVLHLAYGTDSTQDRLIDPLAFAVEQAWKAGIVVVVSAGNDGPGARLNNPAIDPYVLAVGASDTNGTATRTDDQLADFTSTGDGTRGVDVVAPGVSLASLRNPGSRIDVDFPEARVGEDLFRGSGSSQATAVTAGVVALMLERRPELTPDQVKAILMRSADPLAGAGEADGAGQVNALWALLTPTPDVTQDHGWGTGTGSLEAARGTAHVADDGVELRGEQDIFGNRWYGPGWAQLSAAGRSWTGGEWLGRSWTGDCWCSESWTGRSWTGRSWTGRSWTGRSWTGRSWTGRSWTGRSWTGDSWDGRSWTGRSWTGRSWTASSWYAPVAVST